MSGKTVGSSKQAGPVEGPNDYTIVLAVRLLHQKHGRDKVKTEASARWFGRQGMTLLLGMTAEEVAGTPEAWAAYLEKELGL